MSILQNGVAEPGVTSAAVQQNEFEEPGVRAPHRNLLEQYQTVRQFSEKLCETLVAEDYVIQTMPEMSPTKWHLAHTSWFFETFVIKPHLPDYKSLHPQYAYLFNSYYNAAGRMHSRPQRGFISRPTVRETYDYRYYVDSAFERLLRTADRETLRVITPIVILGINHE